MSTRIFFDNGLSLTVAQGRADLIDALGRDGCKDVTLESRSRRPLRINWDHVVAIEPKRTEVLDGSSAA